MPLPFEQPMFTGSTATQEAILGLPSADPMFALQAPQAPPTEPLGMPQLPPAASSAAPGPGIAPGAPVAPAGAQAGGGGDMGGVDRIIQMLLQAAPGFALGAAGKRGGIAGAGAVAGGISSALNDRQQQLERERVMALNERQQGFHEQQVAGQEANRIAAAKAQQQTAVRGILDHARSELSGLFDPAEFARRKEEVRTQLDQYDAGHLVDTLRFSDSRLLGAMAKEDGEHYERFVKNEFGGDHMAARIALADPVKAEYYQNMSFQSPIRNGATVTIHDMIDTLGLHDAEHRMRPVERPRSKDIRSVNEKRNGVWGQTFKNADTLEGQFFPSKPDDPDKPERARQGPSVQRHNEETGEDVVIQTDETGKTTRTSIPSDPGFKTRGAGNGNNSLDARLAAIGKRSADRTGGGAAPATGDRVRVKGPNGEKGTVPAGAALLPGWTRQ